MPRSTLRLGPESVSETHTAPLTRIGVTPYARPATLRDVQPTRDYSSSRIIKPMDSRPLGTGVTTPQPLRMEEAPVFQQFRQQSAPSMGPSAVGMQPQPEASGYNNASVEGGRRMRESMEQFAPTPPRPHSTANEGRAYDQKMENAEMNALSYANSITLKNRTEFTVTQLAQAASYVFGPTTNVAMGAAIANYVAEERELGEVNAAIAGAKVVFLGMSVEVVKGFFAYLFANGSESVNLVGLNLQNFERARVLADAEGIRGAKEGLAFCAANPSVLLTFDHVWNRKEQSVPQRLSIMTREATGAIYDWARDNPSFAEVAAAIPQVANQVKLREHINSQAAWMQALDTPIDSGDAPDAFAEEVRRLARQSRLPVARTEMEKSGIQIYRDLGQMGVTLRNEYLIQPDAPLREQLATVWAVTKGQSYRNSQQEAFSQVVDTYMLSLRSNGDRAWNRSLLSEVVQRTYGDNVDLKEWDSDLEMLTVAAMIGSSSQKHQTLAVLRILEGMGWGRLSPREQLYLYTQIRDIDFSSPRLIAAPAALGITAVGLAARTTYLLNSAMELLHRLGIDRNFGMAAYRGGGAPQLPATGAADMSVIRNILGAAFSSGAAAMVSGAIAYVTAISTDVQDKENLIWDATPNMEAFSAMSREEQDKLLRERIHTAAGYSEEEVDTATVLQRNFEALPAPGEGATES